MSAVQQNSLVTAFVDPAPPEAGGGGAPAAGSPPAANDSIAPFGPGFPPANDAGFAAGGEADGGLAGFTGILNGFLNAMQSFLSSLASQFGLGGGSQAPAAGQTYFTNATASSVGDPHDSFAGTGGNGGAAKGTWDDMRSHGDLLDSDSFAGGYRVATAVTAPGGPGGVTQNASASVLLGGGASKITMNADGSYAVVSAGQNVALQPGRSASLGGGETVTLGAGNSLSVEADSPSGSLTTTLTANGTGGVDVTSSGRNVDLGGYLVTHADLPHYPLPGGSGAPLPAGQNESYEPETPYLQPLAGIAFE